MNSQQPSEVAQEELVEIVSLEHEEQVGDPCFSCSPEDGSISAETCLDDGRLSICMADIPPFLEAQKRSFRSQGMRHLLFGLLFLIVPFVLSVVLYARVAAFTFPSWYIAFGSDTLYLTLSEIIAFVLAPILFLLGLGALLPCSGLLCVFGGRAFIERTKELLNTQPLKVDVELSAPNRTMDGTLMYKAKIVYEDGRTETLVVSGNINDRHSYPDQPLSGLMFGAPFDACSPRLVSTVSGHLLSMPGLAALWKAFERKGDCSDSVESLLERALTSELVIEMFALALMMISFLYLFGSGQLWCLCSIIGAAFISLSFCQMLCSENFRRPPFPL